MMTSLFSSFDPTSPMIMMSNWLSITLFIIILPKKKWFNSMKPNLFSMMTTNMHNESKLLLSKKYNPGSSLIFLSTLTMIIINNFLGLFPHIFTATSHILITLSLALPLWLTFNLYGWMNSTMLMFAHLVPSGTPPMLMSFMVLIETISNMIRPITLSVRLAANMIAGHLLLTLLGNQAPEMATSLLPIIITAQIALISLEAAVALIQAYVFTTLTTLYSSEVN